MQPEWKHLEIETRRVDPRDLIPRKKNARRMSQQQFNRLVENIRIDGRLTRHAARLRGRRWKAGDSVRPPSTQAAIEAGLEEIDVMVITTPLDEERKTAIQLAHNAIAGQDDLQVLRELYDSLTLDGKLFSGLTDDAFGELDVISLQSLTAAGMPMKTVVLSFLPEDAEYLEQAAQRLEKEARKSNTLAAAYRDFDNFFNALVEIKDRLAISSTPIGIAKMAELAIERLNQMQQEGEERND